MKEDFRPHLHDMRTGAATYAVEVRMHLVSKGTGRNVYNGWNGNEQYHRHDRWHVDFIGPEEAASAIFSLRDIASQYLGTGGRTIWEVRDVEDRSLRFDGHPSGMMIRYAHVLGNLNLRVEDLGKRHIRIHPGDPAAYHASHQATYDREHAEWKAANPNSSYGSTYPLSHFGAKR